MSATAFGAIASVLASKAMEGDASATTTRYAPPRNDDQDRMWNDFMDKIYGVVPSDRRFDAEYYLENNPDVAREIEQRTNQYLQQASISDPMAGQTFQSTPGMTGGERGQAVLGMEDWFARDLPDDHPLRNSDAARTRRQLMEDFARQHWEETGQYQGLQASAPQPGDEEAIIKPYRQRLAEDLAYREGVDTDYAGQMGGYTDSLLNRLVTGNDKWQSEANRLRAANRPLGEAAPITVSLGDFSMPMTTGSQRRAQSVLAELMDKELANQNQLGQSVFDARSDQAGLERAVGQAYTPHRAENEYMNWLNNLVQVAEDRRHGLATTRETASMSPDYIGNMRAGMEMGKAVDDWWKNRNAGNGATNEGG